MSKIDNLPADLADAVCGLLQKVRSEKPLIHHITNWVTIYDCAQIVKSFGASPVMAHAEDEVADMVKIANALVLNIGTLTSPIVDAMLLAGEAANRKGIPVVLDVCGAGATPYRDETCAELLNTLKIQIIKGNASEIARVAGENVQTKGVDAAPDVLTAAGKENQSLAGIAERLAKEKQAVVVVTGAQDIVTDGHRTCLVNNGHTIMTHIVGTGCMATSVIGTFAAVTPDPVLAAVSGHSGYEIGAEMAAVGSAGPALFKQQLFDGVFNLSEAAIRENIKVNCERILFYH